MSKTFKPTGAVAKEAQKAIDFKKEHGDEVDAGTQVGWTRANDLADRREVSLDVVKRMVNFFNRHEKNKAISPEHRDEPWKDNGYVAWLLWGGDAGRKWAEQILNDNSKDEYMKNNKTDSLPLADSLLENIDESVYYYYYAQDRTREDSQGSNRIAALRNAVNDIEDLDIESGNIGEGFQKVTGKFKGMRKTVDWTVYPHSEGDEEIIIQTKRYIARVNLKTGKAMLSKAGKSLFMGLSPALGAREVEAPKDIVKQLKDLNATGPQVRLI